MAKKSKPEIVYVLNYLSIFFSQSRPSSTDYTRITFVPDLKKFGLTSLPEDMVRLFHKRAYDVAGCFPNIKVDGI